MIISTNILKNAIEKYSQSRIKREGYSKMESVSAGVSAAFTSAFLVIAIIFLTLEILVMFYCIVISLRCTEPGPERIIHVILAITFTYPYALVMLVFNKCAPNALNNGNV
jgi:NADH:ubiquinone oxidoreductase subunit 3 (subunit A)